MEPIWLKSWPEGVPRTVEYPKITLPQVVGEHAKAFPRREALNFYGFKISYGQFEKLTSAFAASLSNMGVRKGDRVCLFMENCPQFIIAMYAIWRIGAVAVPANPMLMEEELLYELNDSGAETIVLLDLLYPVLHRIKGRTGLKNIIITGYRDFLPEIPGLPLHPSLEVPRQHFEETVELMTLIDNNDKPASINIDPDNDLALLQYTAGVTGTPKGAMISHSNMLSNTICSALWKKVDEGVHLSVLPLFHVTGLVHSMNMPLYSGGTIILLARFDTETVIRAIEKYRVTHWTSIATMNIAVVNYPNAYKSDLSSLTTCNSGGAPIPLKVMERFKELTGVTLIEGYGIAETISQVTVNPPDKPRPGSVGIPVINTDIKIVDLADPAREVKNGEMGELLVKGPQVTRGYWRRPDETEQFIKDGWLATGDLARMDRDGYIYIVGRKQEMINASGFSVFPQEVENYLYDHPAVAEAAVVGIPDPYRGESVKAYVVLKMEYENRISETDIINWSRQKMAAYKYPRAVEFLKELPKSGSGKILRHVLSQKY
ncbi:MAG: AMP-binding protein [Bacillota bacterium]